MTNAVFVHLDTSTSLLRDAKVCDIQAANLHCRYRYILLLCPVLTLCHLPSVQSSSTLLPPHLLSTACNCSDLSVSGECDIVSGQCQCQAGAIGLKCDDCAFGFFGKSLAVAVCVQIQFLFVAFFLPNLVSKNRHCSRLPTMP